jgi:hypothetical protein
MTDLDPRVAKLPHWAQALLAVERGRADAAEHKLQAHLETVEPSSIWYGDWNNKIYIPNADGYQTVYFSTTGQPSKHTFDEVGVQMRKGALYVNAGRAVTIEPIASNCFNVRVRD